ncbi:MAG: hypothetical protein ACKKL5_00540 [Candidatus Komeilibacteria bacterium]
MNLWICQVVLIIDRVIPEIVNHKMVKIVNKGKRNFTQIIMDVAENGDISNPLSVELNGKLRIKLLSKTWTAGRNGFHYAQNVCDLHGRKLQPLHANGNFAIFSYEKAAIVQACCETGSFRIVTLRLDGNCLKADEVMPWTEQFGSMIPEGSRENWLRNYGLKAAGKSQYTAAALDAYALAKAAATEQIPPRPSFFLTREEVKARRAEKSTA